jgi:DNA polymerase-3 subunit gamma/tau
VTTALYRRYRPETFAEVVGQDHVTAPLRQALRTGQTNHAYLFSGPRGCGKTTSARILARCLNCAEGPTDTPCGVCPSCVELARGGPGSLDVVEIDAASHGGVDDARDLRERATFAPARDRYKIFILDEAHMVSPQGFNALLKIVEEPPEHVKFIFATTEPDKVIGTIRSRTHHYPFRLVPPDVMTGYLDQLCRTEGVQAGSGVLPLVVRAGGGSVRDSLSVLDQLIAGSGPDGLVYEDAVALLGYTHASLLDDLVEAISARDGASAFRVVERVISTGHEPRRFVEDLLERLRDLVVLAASGDAAAAVLRDVPGDQMARMQQQAAHLGDAELSRSADLVNAALSEMTGATSPRLHLELLMARLLLPALDDSAAGLGARMDRLEREGVRVAPGSGAVASASAPAPAVPVERVAVVVPAEPVTPAAAAAPVVPAAPVAAEPVGRPTAPPPWDVDEPATPPSPVSHADDAAPTGSSAARDGVPGAVVAEPGADVPASVAPASAEPAAAAPAAAVPAAAAPSAGPSARPEPSVAPVAHDVPTAEPVAPPQRPAGASGGGDTEMLRRRWPEVLDTLNRMKKATWVLISQNAQVMDLDATTLRLGFAAPGLATAFRGGPHAALVQQAVRETLGFDVKVEGVLTGTDAPAPSRPSPARTADAGGAAAGAPSTAQAAASWGEPGGAPDAPPRDGRDASPRDGHDAPPRDGHDAPRADRAPGGPAGRPSADAPAGDAASSHAEGVAGHDAARAGATGREPETEPDPVDPWADAPAAVAGGDPWAQAQASGERADGGPDAGAVEGAAAREDAPGPATAVDQDAADTGPAMDGAVLDGAVLDDDEIDAPEDDEAADLASVGAVDDAASTVPDPSTEWPEVRLPPVAAPTTDAAPAPTDPDRAQTATTDDGWPEVAVPGGGRAGGETSGGAADRGAASDAALPEAGTGAPTTTGAAADRSAGSAARPGAPEDAVTRDAASSEAMTGNRATASAQDASPAPAWDGHGYDPDDPGPAEPPEDEDGAPPERTWGSRPSGGSSAGSRPAMTPPATAPAPVPAPTQPMSGADRVRAAARGAAAGLAAGGAGASARPAANRWADDEPSMDDPDIGSNSLSGVPLLVQMLGAIVIEEQVDEGF